MFTLFVCLVLCAEEPVKVGPIPEPVREYFDRGVAAKAHMLAVMEDDIEKVDVKIRSASGNKSVLVRQKSKLESVLRETKSQTIKPWISSKPAIGHLGHIEKSNVLAVIDSKTMIVRIYRAQLRRATTDRPQFDDVAEVVITNWSTTGYKSGKSIPPDELFRVTALATTLNVEKFTGVHTGLPQWELERVPIGEVSQWKDKYEKEKTQKAVDSPDKKPADAVK